MRGLVAAAVAMLLGLSPAAADPQILDEAAIRDCILAAAGVHRVPPAVLVILLNVEGGSLGRVSHNTNGTVDIGPMQVNEIWLPELAAHWRTTPPRAYAALRDNFCANVEAGAWILRRSLDEPGSDFWDGVGDYHSHNPQHRQAYLRSVLQQATRLRDLVARSPVTTPQVAGDRKESNRE